MKKFLLTAALLLLFASCGGNRGLEALREVESYISEEPAGALAALDSIADAGVRGAEARAKLALLRSMALDKNYVDVTDDSLVSVAVEWYSRHGDADEKLKTYYYQGIVHQNCGDAEAAMESFVKAEAEAAGAGDEVAKGMLYRAMAYIYATIFDLGRAEEYADRARACYKLAGDMDKYAGALTFLAGIYSAKGDYPDAEISLDSVKPLLRDVGVNRKNEYYDLSLRLKKAVGDTLAVTVLLDEYLAEVDTDDILWLDVADFFIFLGEYDSARNVLQHYRKCSPEYKDEPVYYIRTRSLNEAVGDYKAALESEKMYSELMDSLNIAIVNQDTGFIQERYEKELRLERVRNSRTMIIFVAAFGIVLLSSAVYLLRGRLRRKNSEMARYRENLSRLKQEKDELSAMIAENPPVDRQSMKVLADRLELLNRIIAGEISSSRDRKLAEDLERLVSNRDEFLYTTRMTFAAAHPEFIAFLEDRGLTEGEVQFCCLYAIGLRGKDISNYVGRGGHYNESSVIRSKLGLGPHDTNLGNYLRSLL